jgi:uncharacterized damage-inducible protein DinB
MIATFQDLVRHKAHADTALLKAIREYEPAAQNQELLKVLHHAILANRFWLSLFLERPFSFEEESRVPEGLDAIADVYRTTQLDELEWVARIDPEDLERAVQTPFIPDKSFSVAQGLLQVCMHSQGHRAQCAARLRALGGAPPAADFILWLKDRPKPEWW